MFVPDLSPLSRHGVGQWAHVQCLPPHVSPWTLGPFSIRGLVAMHKGDLVYIALAALVYYTTWPTVEEAALLPPNLNLLMASPTAWVADQFSPGPVTIDFSGSGGWVAVLFARNFVIEFGVYELWHQLLFGVFATKEVNARRISTTDPYAGPSSRVWRERLASCAGFVMSSIFEVVVIHRWATGSIAPCPADDAGFLTATLPLFFRGCQMMAVPTAATPVQLAWFIVAFPLVIQLRGVHFFFVHRGMHPWWNRKGGLVDGDVGAFLYRHVHSFHHKSFNPGP
jgi:hypothetical protein